ncbi:zinc finger BED domain-containing protein 4 [Syngnathus typhle]|uniref:zinc finger BED domain-containing protein 4 n=1 Tax=Syngnathus typhle TaxID=161592 RepID=UPI002A6B830A|nr:zinc finger BED domain-containing protein 4 [Syngnathus typhle]XP_061124240.1 zinc finger BED domain-containing protein 4 [Syngnathus typhle]XP_061124242.1 zinc finger BED domain-containing protein 4 [Syngnathus typhle]XP_061124243.1 zinc finger BED domain-containing protein 4 [Syngnathus typhle]
MDREDDASGVGDDSLDGSVEKKREAKGTLLKIEGQDGYVFKSYSMKPHETTEAKSSCSSKTLEKALSQSSHLSSQGDKQSESDADPASPSLSSKWLGVHTHENAENGKYEPGQPIKDESRDANDLEDETQDFERLAFGNSFGPFLSRDGDDCNLLSGYTSTLYDVAMDAVTQSLLASMRNQSNPRKKSPAWNHFCISPRDNTKAICLYCMKEFSRGKNEKDLSTSCLMRHVRRAHPTMLYQEGADSAAPNLNPLASSIPPSPNSPKNGDLNTYPGSKNTSPSASSLDNSDLSSKEVLSKAEVKPEPLADSIFNALESSHSSENNLEEISEERHPSNPKNSSSRRRSAVWKHFYLSPVDNSKAVCIHCMNEFSRGKNGKDLGTSCLIRHMWRAHKEVVVEENGLGNHIPPPYSNPPLLLSRALLHDPLDIKKESPLLPSSPETILDELPQTAVESGDIKDESDEAMLLSERDPSLNLPFGAHGDDTPSTSSPCDLSDAPGHNQNHVVFEQNKKIMKRVKSEVWQHFIVSPVDQLKALCRYCPCVISRGKRGDFGTSCLMRHLMRRHPDVLQNQKVADDKEPASQPFDTAAKASKNPGVRKKPQSVFSKKTSKLWNHFSISPADPTKVVCLHCSRTISRGKKTTNLGTSCLFRHMQRFHGHFLESNNAISGDAPPSAGNHVKQEPAAMPVYKREQNHGSFDQHHPVAQKITKLIAEMLALDLQPSAMVENAGLSRLLEYFQPQYCLPPSSYFTSTAIPEMYGKVRDVVLTHLKEAEGGVVHFTTSIWLSSQTKEYLTLTAHWATYESRVRPQGQDFHCSALLSVSQIDCDQDMHDIPKQLEYLWDSWITSAGLKRGFTVTDNTSIRNNLEDHGHVTVQCFAHTIDLIVSEAIKSQRMVQNLLSMARKICERIHRSAKAKEKLAELQKDHRLPENRLIQDIPSKWRTSLLMLERLVEQQKAVDELSIECNFREIVSCDQWEVMQSVCNALKPFEVAYGEVRNRAATLGQVIPLIHILNRKIELLFDETVGIDNMLRSLKEATVSRMSATLNDPRFTWATMLDPRYKTSLFTEEEAERCKQDLIQELDLFSSTSAEESPLLNGRDEAPASDKDNIWSLMADLRQKVKHEEKAKSSELAVLEYLEEDILDQSCDPLDYWNLKKFLWPELAKVAARYVGCPPSIVPAEALFSTAGVNCAPNHPRPVLENMEGLLFLKVNLPLIFFQY